MKILFTFTDVSGYVSASLVSYSEYQLDGIFHFCLCSLNFIDYPRYVCYYTAYESIILSNLLVEPHLVIEFLADTRLVQSFFCYCHHKFLETSNSPYISYELDNADD